MEKEDKSEIVSITSRKLVPYILLFGLYLISYGHFSPGGGFQGGVVLGAGIILLCLSRGISSTEINFPPRKITFLEISMITAFILLGIAGLIMGGSFLSNILPGKAEEVPTPGFIFLLDLVIGLKAGAGIILIFYSFLAK
ncbi:MAG: MnhB domain-containing protein [Candidatus Aerophobetes bacterium]|nr:MnhB domain-containing protein [Candidatus Aerophobetes bacterium]